MFRTENELDKRTDFFQLGITTKRVWKENDLVPGCSDRRTRPAITHYAVTGLVAVVRLCETFPPFAEQTQRVHGNREMARAQHRASHRGADDECTPTRVWKGSRQKENVVRRERHLLFFSALFDVDFRKGLPSQLTKCS